MFASGKLLRSRLKPCLLSPIIKYPLIFNGVLPLR
ncbi:hypothetical protein BAZSYMB_SCAFFOLD00017_1 [Bathymodiolus azoricus thioautotrophic gill symbiont]|uniref:Uncharacterized protein n=1 Tax=Bathymodiolus azoricus thioautotrophic gill symbiont TaxID=235205 RepID=A0A1H6JSZ3_9GAMM|nr:hypothetical protein BAZSYMB_SCAFFOLD00017_1 [Bathymodiolus azoricus thioautotrophic gill symbiont]